MYESHNVLYSHYGAYALKARYQRNLFQSQMLVVGALVLSFAITALWPKERIMTFTPPKDPIPRDSVRAHPETPPTIKRDFSGIKPEVPKNVRGGIPEPVSDEPEFEVSVPSRQDLEVMVGVGVGDSLSAGGIQIDTSGVDPIGEPGVFRKLELNPEVVSDVEAEYPQLAQRVGIEGTVILWGLVSEDGLIIEIRTARSSGYASLDEAAIAALRVTRWKPGIQNGKPVKCWVIKRYKFELD